MKKPPTQTKPSATQQVSAPEIGTGDEWSGILENMKDGTFKAGTLAQAFEAKLAQIAVCIRNSKTTEVFLVTNARKIFKVEQKTVGSVGAITVSGSPDEYSQLVSPRWSKAGLERFRTGEYHPDAFEVYRRMKAVLETLIDFTHEPAYSDIVCCWIISTYFYRMFEAFPYLAVLGPKGSGKTKLASIIEQVAFNPLRTDSITNAQLFRSVEVTGGTLILDEQEGLDDKYGDGDRLALLRGGYKRGGSALRSLDTSTGYKTQKFDTYSPKMLINTSGMEELLADRCVPIHMLRSIGDQGKALISKSAGELTEIRDDLYHMVLEGFEAIHATAEDNDFCPNINNRQRERWLPLLAIASTFCPDRLHVIEERALQDSNNSLLTDPIDAAFLAVLDKLVSEPVVQLAPGKITTALASYLADDTITSQKVGKLIKKFLGSVSTRSSSKGSHRYRVTREQVNDLQKRYPTTDRGSQGSLTDGL